MSLLNLTPAKSYSSKTGSASLSKSRWCSKAVEINEHFVLTREALYPWEETWANNVTLSGYPCCSSSSIRWARGALCFDRLSNVDGRFDT